MKISRRGQVPPFIVMDVMTAAAAREKTHGDVLHLEVGQPSTPAPAGVLAAAQAALRDDKIGYTVALGIPPLRQAIADHYGRAYGTTVAPQQVVVTTGSSGAFLLAFLAAFDVGDRVALAAPGYPAYRNILTALGIEVVEIPAGPDTRYQPTPELLEKHGGKLAGLIIASPANPTGTMLSPEALADLTAYCEAKSIRLVSDEIYHGITYGMGTATALQTSGSAIIVNSFSKYYSMTGWRLGWLVLPEELLRPVECLAQNLTISPPTLSQYAAVAAFDCGEELDRNVARYARNRSLLLEALPRAGFDRLAPADGAFYLYAEIGHLTNDSVEFCRRMLAETGVAATPGVDFDPVRGHATMRFSFAGATGEMAEAADRLHRWLR
ncbi:aminotransferase class I/II-fold pyridoxal phosphate-dependent enzyme [Mycobacterium sp. KBS0706]|uniref:aminotransferase class I/II-fold pyridoxal phosphate-dependent enzyme n=1 Tax=Mycobacterium sp. KBS0706 TaxID=2578109 RepID=UPI00110FC0D8|nr:aminotransferase class I/II-fold pyridoxal phosphate-dependent enzyme [Mycobacterium sp. KBS0706]TSD84981.1 aminotransferase class I/II-fold pyridoxal phosphate-dependent enzyme [Mycobacterium sp. KBS0706]